MKADRGYLRLAYFEIKEILKRIQAIDGQEGPDLEELDPTSKRNFLHDKSEPDDFCSREKPIVNPVILEPLVQENRVKCRELISEVKSNRSGIFTILRAMEALSNRIRDWKGRIAKHSNDFDGKMSYGLCLDKLPCFPDIRNKARGTYWELIGKGCHALKVEATCAANVFRPIHTTIDMLVKVTIGSRNEVRHIAKLVNALLLTTAWLENLQHKEEAQLEKIHIYEISKALLTMREMKSNKLIEEIVCIFARCCLTDPNVDDVIVEVLINLVQKNRIRSEKLFDNKLITKLREEIYSLDLPNFYLNPYRVRRIVLADSSLEGYEVSAQHYYDTDIKQTKKPAIKASVQGKYKDNNTLFLVSVNNGESYQIILTFDKLYCLGRQKGQPKTGWGLSLRRGGREADRNDQSTYAAFYKEPSANSYWQLNKIGRQNKYTISLAKDRVGTNQTGWELCVQTNMSTDIRDETSFYLTGHEPTSDLQNNVWRII